MHRTFEHSVQSELHFVITKRIYCRARVVEEVKVRVLASLTEVVVVLPMLRW